jgi:hypothetical protein
MKEYRECEKNIKCNNLRIALTQYNIPATGGMLVK